MLLKLYYYSYMISLSCCNVINFVFIPNHVFWTFVWLWDRSPSLRSVWTVCWLWTQSCWNSRTEIWVRSSRMHHWDKRILRALLQQGKRSSTTVCGFSPTCGSACTLTDLPCWRCSTGRASHQVISICFSFIFTKHHWLPQCKFKIRCVTYILHHNLVGLKNTECWTCLELVCFLDKLDYLQNWYFFLWNVCLSQHEPFI